MANEVLSERTMWDLCDRCGKHGRELTAQVTADGEFVDRESDRACTHPMIRQAIEKTAAALAARSGVDVEALVATAAKATHCCCRQVSEEEWDHSGCLQHCQYPMIEWDAAADAIRLALAQQAAQHEAREAKWDELRDLERGYWIAIEGRPFKRIEARPARIGELRRELGVE